MAAFVLAATAGLLGSGPLSRGRVAVPGVMVVDYERFARLQTDETLTVWLESAATAAAPPRGGDTRAQWRHLHHPPA